MKKVNLISGGIDSTIMALIYTDALNVFIDYGQKYAEEEKRAILDMKIPFEVIKINLQLEDNIYIWNRNLTLASIVAMKYHATEIKIAGLKDDNCKDKTEAEFERMSELISRYCDEKIKIISPFWNYTKGEIIQMFLETNNGAVLEKTFSCYNPKSGKPCNDCPACLRRTMALETNGIKCPPLSKAIINSYLKKIHTYDEDRISRFLIYLKQRIDIIAIDIDGIICEEADVNYRNRLPIKENIDKINDLFLSNIIILYTARLSIDRKLTEDYLAAVGLNYHALITNKLPYNYIIDDRTISLEYASKTTL